jgi:uncharacterized protein
MPDMTASITVIKRDPAGREVIRYAGTLLEKDAGSICLEARFNRPDMPFMGTTLKHGDRFVETYFFDRWFNLFEIHDRDDDALKGWYCNVGKPAVFESEDCLAYVDLALDVWMTPQGRQTVLDEDEFAALTLDASTRRKARQALAELQAYLEKQFDPGS